MLFRYRLAPYMIGNVTKRGYQQPTPIQMQAIPLMIHVSTCCYVFGLEEFILDRTHTQDGGSNNSDCIDKTTW